MQRLQIDRLDPHRLSTQDGHAHFLLGDTAWELLHRLTRDEIRFYLDNRAQKGFNLVCTVFLAEFDGLRVPNAEGHLPLIDMDPTSLNPHYLDLARFLFWEADQRGMAIGLLPTWGDKMTAPWGTGPRIFELGSEELCRSYGRHLAEGLSCPTNVLWVLGGDRPANLNAIPKDWSYPWDAGFTQETDWEPMWRAMGEGIRAADPKALFAYHPQGGSLSTSQFLPTAPWLDINMMQSGHGGGHDVPVWDWIERDYQSEPAKPTLDAEPNYEDHAVSPWPTWDPRNGFFDDYDVRKQCWRSVLSGGCGVIYGHGTVWQFWDRSREPILICNHEWKDALDRPGAFHVGFLKQIIERFGDRVRVPDTSIFVDGPGEGPSRKACLRTTDGSMAVIYTPTPEPLHIRMPDRSGSGLSITWVNPADISDTRLVDCDVSQEAVNLASPAGHTQDSVFILSTLG